MAISTKEASKKHRGETLYEIVVHDMENKSSFCYASHETNNFYLSLDEAKEAARKVAYNIAWGEQLEKLDHPEYNTEWGVYLACIMTGRKFSKNGVLYGFGHIIYMVSHQTKKVTDKFKFDKRFKNPRIDEYTEQPKLTKDMFYQWPDKD